MCLLMKYENCMHKKYFATTLYLHSHHDINISACPIIEGIIKQNSWQSFKLWVVLAIIKLPCSKLQSVVLWLGLQELVGISIFSVLKQDPFCSHIFPCGSYAMCLDVGICFLESFPPE